MKKCDGKSLQKTLGVAATMAALGASLGVSTVSSAAEATNIKAGRVPHADAEAKQMKPGRRQGTEANQLKADTNQSQPGVGASQLKVEAKQLKLDKAR